MPAIRGTVVATASRSGIPQPKEDTWPKFASKRRSVAHPGLSFCCWWLSPRQSGGGYGRTDQLVSRRPELQAGQLPILRPRILQRRSAFVDRASQDLHAAKTASQQNGDTADAQRQRRRKGQRQPA